jgi:hypothetical protein
MRILEDIKRSLEPEFRIPPGAVVSADRAILCPDCNVISENHDGRCLRCQSEHVLNLSEIINRTPMHNFILDILSVLRREKVEEAA